MEFGSARELFGTLLQIALINIVLSGDNAVVIALACRSLPARQQKWALLLGSVGAVVLMTILTACAAYLLSLPYVELAGSVLLLWIGVKLLLPEGGGDDKLADSTRLAEAVRTIIVADAVMSFDNVLSMAGAAEGHLGMLFVGLAITIPLILFGSAVIIRLMNRLPILVTLGGALLGWVAGEMATSDGGIGAWIGGAPYLRIVLPALGAVLVVAIGKLLGRRRAARTGADPSR